MGDTQVDGRICWSLLRKVLISGGTLNGYLPTRDGDMEHYHINEDGQRLLKDPNYVTQFERALTHNAAFQRDLLGMK